MRILIGLTFVVLFNDFVGEVVSLIGALLVYVGESLKTIPNLF